MGLGRNGSISSPRTDVVGTGDVSVSLTYGIQTAGRLARNRWAQAILGVAASSGFAYLVGRTLALRDVADTFRNFPAGVALLALAPLAAAILLRAARWHVLLPGEPATFGQVVLTQNTGIGLNNLSPIRMVSEPVQLALITRRYKVPFPTAFTTLVGGNVLDIFTSALLMGLGVLLVPSLREGKVSIQLLGALIMFIVSILVFVAVARGLQSIPLANRVRFFQQITVAFGTLKDKPARLWASFAATAFHWLALGLAGWIVAQGLGIDAQPLTMVTVLVAATFFTSAAPSAPAGVGAYHFAVVTMLTGLGADPAAALSFAVVMHLMVVAPPLAIALVMTGRVGLGFLRSVDVSVEPKYRPVPSGAAPDAREI